MKKNAVVLLSGGLDSATTAAIAKVRGFQLYALSIDYGQRHRFELDAATRLGRSLDVRRHFIQKLDLSQFGGSALVSQLSVPKGRSSAEMSAEIPVTYVPARNTIFLSLALALAEVVSAADIFLGVNAIDYSGYPDCRPEFIEAFAKLAQLATKAGVEGRLQFRIEAPLIQLSKAEIIREGHRLGVDFAMTHSCYDPDEAGRACGQCDACQLRMQGFADAGLVDPIEYQELTQS